MKTCVISLMLILFSNSLIGGNGRLEKSKLNFSTPWSFEENKGQVTGQDAAKVKFFYQSGTMSAFLLKSGIAYQFEKTIYPEGYKPLDKFANLEEREENDKLLNQVKRETYRMDVELLGANPNAEITTEGKSEDYIQYYNHNALDVHAYQKITYRNIYPNIDWVIYVRPSFQRKQESQRKLEILNQVQNDGGQTLKYDFIVHPGGNPADIQLQTHWVEDLGINADGSLRMKNRMGEVTEQAPISYQEGREIGTKFNLKEDLVRFDIQDYDKSRDLVIDPLIRIWATYYGGNSSDLGNSSSIDEAGNIYMAGWTYSNTAIAVGGYQNSYAGGGYLDAFLVKFTNTGARLWATYYGGTSTEYGNSCSTDKFGNIYLSGHTNSSSNLASGGHQNTSGGNGDLYLVKFDSGGSRLWATFYGGNGLEHEGSCTTDGIGNVYLSGYTNSSSGIASGGYQNSIGGGYDAFLVKFNSTGTRQWATYCGGNANETNMSCTNDKTGNIYITGYTNSSSGIASAGYQNAIGGGEDAYLVKFDSLGTLLWATYYGGAINDYGHSCTADRSGNVILTGRTLSTTSIASGGHQNSLGGFSDAFLVKFSSGGTYQWSTYYGGGDNDYSNSCITDDANNLFIVGLTKSTTAIASGGVQNTLGGNYDAFIVKFSSGGTRLWASYIGGSNNDYGYSCNSDRAGHVFLAGLTESTSGITFNGYQNTSGGSEDAFLVKIYDTIYPVSIAISKSKSDTICAGTLVEFSSFTISGGNFPKYKWYKNGTLVDTTASYTSSSLSDGDSIKCLLKSSLTTINPDSAWSNVFKFRINPIITKIIDTNICQGNSYFFKGKYRTTAGTYRDTLVNSFGCDSFVTLNLTVKDTSSFSYSVTTTCFSPSYFFNGAIRSNSGLYKDTLLNSQGCDSFVYLDLTVMKPTSGFTQVIRCMGDSVMIDGVYRKNAGTYYDTLVNSMSCDSFLTIDLQFGIPDTTYQTQTICANKSFLFNGGLISAAGNYRDTLINQFGCDSLLILTLNVKPISTKTLVDTICQGEAVRIGSFSHNSSGVFVDILTNSLGCDSIVTLYLTVYPTPTDTSQITICSKDSWMFNGMKLSNPGNYRDTLQTSKGCDSFVVLHLSKYSQISSTVYQTACSNKDFYFKGIKRDSSGVFYDTLKSYKGCDSFVILNFHVIPTSSGVRKDTICANDSIYFNKRYINNPGVYKDTILNRKGCDSFVTLNLSKRSSKSVDISNVNHTLVATKGFIYYQWFLVNSTLKSQNFYYLSPPLSGQYSVRVWDSFGCNYTSSSFNYFAASILDLGTENLLIYPNPTSSIFYLESSYLKDKDCAIVIRNAEGRNVSFTYHRISSSLISISTSHLSKGFYFIHLNTKGLNVQKKFIID